MKEKIPTDAAAELEDLDALDEGLISSGPETEDESVIGALDPETGLPVEDVAFSGIHVEGGEAEES